MLLGEKDEQGGNHEERGKPSGGMGVERGGSLSLSPDSR